MPEKISIVKESGETVSSNIVSVFTIPDTEKKYIITTENAVDPHGLTVLHVSEIVDGELKKIATDEEWSSIKTIMRAIISGNVGSYKYLPAVEVIKAEGQYSRDISVSASASKQMIDNYSAADTSGAEENSGNTIFPENKEEVSEDNEVMPGIAEVNENAPAEAPAPAPAEEVTAPVAEPAPVETPSVPAETPAVPEAPATPAVEPPVENVAPQVEPAVPETPAPAPAPVVEQPAVPVSPEPVAQQPEVALSNDVQVPQLEPVAPPAAPATEVAPVQPVESTPVAVQQPVTPITVETAAPVDNAQMISVAPEISPTPVQEAATTATVAQPLPGSVVPDISQMMAITQPAQTVPNAQIAQGVPELNLPPVEFDANAAPSFKPEATLDEVVKGAQDMFMEGVKNLVQTIQEKVYRDLYIKEAEMKKREALVAQKEQMLNTQFATMMSNITANFNGIPVVDPNLGTNNTDPQA